ncbi:hypothetical protein RND81_02G099000 [Saponaria officinalis]|uniref:Cytochrome P450 n=1 Tax=Saponaria officinalis TaxID=3572 RepID=A0AAW1MX97_SAPOF
MVTLVHLVTREYISIFLLVSFIFLTCKLLKKLKFLSNNHVSNNGGQNSNFPPGSRGVLPLIGETLHFLAAIYSKHGFYHFVHLRHLWYGKCFKTHIFGETHVFVSSTKAAKEILSNDLGKFTKKYIRSIGEVIGSQSVLCASRQTHKLIRRQLLDLFSSNSISEFTNQFDPIVVSTISNWAYMPKVLVLDEAQEMTFKAMSKMLLSLEDGSELDMLRKDVACVCQAMLAFPLKFPWTRFTMGLKARRRIMCKLEKMIQKRRSEVESAQSSTPHGQTDCLDILLQAKSEEINSVHQVSHLMDTQIKDNILTMIIAGQDTTASAIAWMVKYLDENQEVLQLLKDELQSLNNKVGSKSCLTFEDLNSMTYASKVVKESLRMSSIVPWFPRVALYDCNVLGYTIKKGWNINVDARSIHLDPTLHNNPYTFNPSRMKQNRTAS